MKKPKLPNKPRTVPTMNKTKGKQPTLALDVPTSGLNLSIQSSKASKTNSTSNG